MDSYFLPNTVSHGLVHFSVDFFSDKESIDATTIHFVSDQASDVQSKIESFPSYDLNHTLFGRSPQGRDGNKPSLIDPFDYFAPPSESRALAIYHRNFAFVKLIFTSERRIYIAPPAEAQDVIVEDKGQAIRDVQDTVFKMSKGSFGELNRILSRINKTLYPSSRVSSTGRITSLV